MTLKFLTLLDSTKDRNWVIIIIIIIIILLLVFMLMS